LGLGFRYGAKLDGGEANPWGTGLGLNVGYTLEKAVYFGGNAELFFGVARDYGGAELSGNAWQIAAEGGYDLGLGDHVVLRPKIGLGLAGISISCAPEGIGCIPPSSDVSPALAPGLTFVLLTKSFHLTVDARYTVVFTDPDLSKAMIFSLGFGF
jgi:hypothetical protein